MGASMDYALLILKLSEDFLLGGMRGVRIFTRRRSGHEGTAIFFVILFITNSVSPHRYFRQFRISC
jgi:hypothetical protein